jgi:hypothetical protein
MMDRDTTFFKNVYQSKVDFNGEEAKLPIFYYDASCISGVFFAKVDKLKKFLPRKDYHPLRIAPGIGTIAINCFTYHDTDIRPYNELSISIPLSFKKRTIVPSAGLLSCLIRNEFHAYIHHLPVTTKIALDAGVDIYNYPKFIAEIDFSDEQNRTLINLKEEEEFILQIEADKIPANTQKTIRYVTYPVKDNSAQHADILMNAQQFGQSFNPNSMKIKLGKTHKISNELRNALIGSRPLLYQYIPKLQMILYNPSRLD